MTEDRLSGALLVGTALDVTHQRSWQADNYDVARQRAALVGSTTSSYLSQLALEDPLAAHRMFDSAALKLIRDQEALGEYFSPSWTAFQADRGRCFSVMVDGASV